MSSVGGDGGQMSSVGGDGGQMSSVGGGGGGGMYICSAPSRNLRFL